MMARRPSVTHYSRNNLLHFDLFPPNLYFLLRIIDVKCNIYYNCDDPLLHKVRVISVTICPIYIKIVIFRVYNRRKYPILYIKTVILLHFSPYFTIKSPKHDYYII